MSSETSNKSSKMSHNISILGEKPLEAVRASGQNDSWVLGMSTQKDTLWQEMLQRWAGGPPEELVRETKERTVGVNLLSSPHNPR